MKMYKKYFWFTCLFSFMMIVALIVNQNIITTYTENSLQNRKNPKYQNLIRSLNSFKNLYNLNNVRSNDSFNFKSTSNDPKTVDLPVPNKKIHDMISLLDEKNSISFNKNISTRENKELSDKIYKVKDDSKEPESDYSTTAFKNNEISDDKQSISNKNDEIGDKNTSVSAGTKAVQVDKDLDNTKTPKISKQDEAVVLNDEADTNKVIHNENFIAIPKKILNSKKLNIGEIQTENKAIEHDEKYNRKHNEKRSSDINDSGQLTNNDEKLTEKSNTTSSNLKLLESETVRREKQAIARLLAEKTRLTNSLFKQYYNQYVMPNDLKIPFYRYLLKTIRQNIKSQYAKVNNTLVGSKIPQDKVHRVIIVSTWRSGSTFLGDILKSYPGSFYSFEPLHMHFKGQHVQSGPDVQKATNMLRNIFTCDYVQEKKYAKYMSEIPYLMKPNTQLWKTCFSVPKSCFDPYFLKEACESYPINIIKTVRMGLSPVEDLLNNPNLNVKVIHLVRDPRGALHSRKNVEWCQSPSCKDSKTVCEHLQKDLELSIKLKRSHPKNFLVLKYEELSKRTEAVARFIFKFVGLPFHDDVTSFIQHHTKILQKTQPKEKHKLIGTYTTFRDSSQTASAWKKGLSFKEVEGIQNNCRTPMTMLRYTIYNNSKEFENG